MKSDSKLKRGPEFPGLFLIICFRLPETRELHLVTTQEQSAVNLLKTLLPNRVLKIRPVVEVKYLKL